MDFNVTLEVVHVWIELLSINSAWLPRDSCSFSEHITPMSSLAIPRILSHTSPTRKENFT